VKLGAGKSHKSAQFCEALLEKFFSSGYIDSPAISHMGPAMNFMKLVGAARPVAVLVALLGAIVVAGCANHLPPPPPVPPSDTEYRVGPGDQLGIFVWQNRELSTEVPVRPDGKISLPLINDMVAAGKTPTQLSTDIQDQLKKYVNNPLVTVIVHSFLGPYSQQVRIVGEAVRPQSVPYRDRMTVLDAMIQVGGLTQLAAGNRATLVRYVNGKQESFNIKLDDLIRDGDMSANAPLAPGDVIIIPQSYF
jgi:polysaccharide export outer membrane protein